MIVKVISHLPYCLCTGSLILHGHFGQTSCSIKFYIACIEDVFVIIVDFYVFVTGNTLIVVAAHWSSFHSFQLFELSSNFISICIFVFVFICVLIFLFIFWTVLWRGRWRWFGSSFDVVRREKSFLVWTLDHMSEPPSVFESLFDQNFIPLFKGQISNFLLFFFFLVVFFIVLVFFSFIFVKKFVFSFLSQLFIMFVISSSFKSFFFLFRFSFIFIERFLLLVLCGLGEGCLRKIVECLCNKHQLQVPYTIILNFPSFCFQKPIKL